MGLPGLNQYQARINVLAQGHNAVTPMRLEPTAPRSRVKHSTTEPLRSHVHELLVNCLFKLAQEKGWLGELTVQP